MSNPGQSFAQGGAEIATVHSSAKEPKQENLWQEDYLASTTSSTIVLQSILLPSIFLPSIFLPSIFLQSIFPRSIFLQSIFS
jgi:hypothetical protein